MESNMLISDIVERDPGLCGLAEFPIPPAPPSSTGFPQHKTRWKSSTLRRRQTPSSCVDGLTTDRAELSDGQQLSHDEIERRRIDLENRRRIASMSPQEVAQAQQNLFNNLDPAVVQRLLQRAHLDEDTRPSPFDGDSSPPPKETSIPSAKLEPPAPEMQRQAQEENKHCSSPGTRRPKSIAKDYDEDQAPAQIPPDLFPITDLPKSTHFPAAPSLPDVDPSDPNFLETLHGKYFANLPADPSKLAWMAPLPSQDSPADKESPYYPHPEIGVSALRFDFRGRFLPPRLSRSISSIKGLHHHGQAPEAAGYTISELARLARSAVPAQRCLSFQTLGRILFRLGKGEWGSGEDDPIAMGVWDAVKQHRVLDSLMEAASTEGGHQGSRAYAMEALWLLEKGGWKERLRGR